MFRRSGASSIKMMAADLAPLAPAFTAPACSNSAGSVNWCSMLSMESGFAQRAVKMSSTTTASAATIIDPSTPGASFGSANEGPRAVPGHAFVASLDGQRLGVGTGSQAVKSMRKYLNSNKLEDIHGGCDWAVLNCTPTSSMHSSIDASAMSNTNATQFCISATQKGSTCSTTVVRGCSGHIAYASSPKTATVETNYFYAKPNDFVMLHSLKRAINVAASSSSVAADEATAVFHRAIQHAARSNKSKTVDVESLAESVLETFHQHGEEATVVIARLGEICPNAPQPPVTN